MNAAQRTDTVRDVAERVALWNEVRTDDRGLPAAGADPLYDTLIEGVTSPAR